MSTDPSRHSVETVAVETVGEAMRRVGMLRRYAEQLHAALQVPTNMGGGEALGFPQMQVALSRVYAVQTDLDGYTWFWRGGNRIGMVADPQTIRLGRRYNYLREELRESLIFGEGVNLL